MPTYHLFIYRRDLRIHDNLALLSLLDRVKNVDDAYILPVFIFNKKQIEPKENAYFNKNSVEFLIQSLVSLNEALFDKLIFIHSSTSDVDVLDNITKHITSKTSPGHGDLGSVTFNADYTPYAVKRDKEIKAWCKKNNIECHTSEDYSLLPMNTVLTGSGTFFSVFTPFYRKFLTMSDNVLKPEAIDKALLKSKLYDGKKSPITMSEVVKNKKDIHKYYMNEPNELLFVKGGRDNALDILKRIRDKAFKEYDKERDYPSLKDKTTKLSAYLKFGCVSIREAFDAIKDTYGIGHGLVRELIWREFYALVVWNKPRVLEGQLAKNKSNLPFKNKYDHVRWSSDKVMFQRWCDGNTGFPIVDAAMRQMNAIGWMHNRCRMIVASFLVKDMLMDWTLGEKYFAQKLVDYDPASNNGGWQFSSSTGVDAQPYFRIFNPFSQSLKFDADCEYIKYWVPELKNITNKDIHSWDVSYTINQDKTNYPAPMLVHKEQSKKAIALFKEY
jgi:deoxyribodipyrimidine photo-lyase